MRASSRSASGGANAADIRDDQISVFHAMTEMRIRHLPVVDRARLVGVVSIGDVAKPRCDRYQDVIDTRRTRIPGDQPARKL